MQSNRLRLSAQAIVVIVVTIAILSWVVIGAILANRVVEGPSVTQQSESPTTTTQLAAAAQEPVQVEQSVTVFLSNFYAAYADADADRIATYFTVDRRPEDIQRYQELFTGEASTRLFLAPNALERVSGHELTAASEQPVGWKLTIREQRIDQNGSDLFAVTTIMHIVPAPSGTGTWLVSSYSREGAEGTFEALVSQPF